MLKSGEHPIPTLEEQSKTLDIIEARGPIDLEAVEYTPNKGVDTTSEEFISRMWPLLYHFYETEATVPKNKKDVFNLLHNAPEQTRRFATLWETEESFHSLPFGKLIVDNGGELPVADDSETRDSIMWAGYAGEYSQGFHDMSLLAYNLYGATQENLTITGYRFGSLLMAAAYSKAFAKTAMTQIRKQEPTHADWYEKESIRLASTMPPWQVFTVASTLKHFWNTVGTKGLERQRRFALLTRLLIHNQIGTGYDGPAEDIPAIPVNELAKFISPVQSSADILLNPKTKETKLVIVREKMKEAINRGNWAPAIVEFVGRKYSDTPKPSDFMLRRLIKQQDELDAYQSEQGTAA